MTQQERQLKRRQRAVEELARSGNVSLACKAAAVDRSTFYRWIEKDPEFAKVVEAAREEAGEVLEAEAWRRAHDGVDEPVFHQGRPAGVWLDADGKPVGETADELRRAVRFQPYGIRKYSDTLLIFLLKGARPQKYRERYEHTGANGAPLVAPTVTVYMPGNGR